MNRKLSKVINYIFSFAIIMSIVLLLLWRIVLQGVRMEQHYTIENSAYMLGILGVVMIAVVGCMRILCKRDYGLRYLIVTNFMLATWIYLRSEAVYDPYNGCLLLEVVKLTMLTLLVVPVVLFFDEFQEYRYHKTNVTFLILPIVDWVSCMVFYIIFKVRSNDIYMACQIIVIMILLICVYHLILDVKKGHRAVTRQVLVSMVFVFCGACLEIFYVWNPQYYWMDILFGFLAFVTILGIFQSVAVTCVREYLIEQRQQHQQEANSILVKLKGDVRRYLDAIQAENQDILEHCMDDEMFAKATELEWHRWKLSGLLHNMEDCISTNVGIEPCDLEKVDMAGVLNQILYEANDEAERKNIELDIRIEEKFPRAIWGVEYCAYRMLFNLLFHAIEITDKGGKVTFQTGYLDIGNDAIKLITTVESTDVGIAKEELSRLQHIFKHLNEIDISQLDGIGFGLQTAAIFAKYSYCTMTIESEIGKGTRIQIASVCNVADATPIGEFQDWYVVKETYYQKYRKRILETQKEVHVDKKIQENKEEIPVNPVLEEQNSIDNKNILYAGDIHVDGALKYVGDDYEQYVQIMKLFPEKKNEKQRLLQEYFDTKDLLNYTIQVHALKNNARMLGADKLADMAFEHEKAGTQKDENYLLEHYDELLTEWNRVEAVFSQYLKQEKGESSESEDNGSQQKISMEQWQNKIEQIIECLELFQKKEALEFLEQLSTYQLLEGQLDTVNSAIDAVKRYDYDGAITILKEN